MAKRGPKESPYREGESWKTGSSLRDERVAAYLEWMLTPEPLREPSTKRAFADALGVHESTLWRYEQDRSFQKEFMSRRRGLLKVMDVDKILRAQIQIAADPDNRGSTQAARLLLDWMEKDDGSQGHTVDLTELSEEELMELVHEVISDKS